MFQLMLPAAVDVIALNLTTKSFNSVAILDVDLTTVSAGIVSRTLWSRVLRCANAATQCRKK